MPTLKQSKFQKIHLAEIDSRSSVDEILAKINFRKRILANEPINTGVLSKVYVKFAQAHAIVLSAFSKVVPRGMSAFNFN